MFFKNIVFKSTVLIKRRKFDLGFMEYNPRYVIKIIGGKRFYTNDFINESALSFGSLDMYSEIFKGEITTKRNPNFSDVMKEIQEKYPEVLI